MKPLRFVFGVHIHQPVGNFDHVFEQHVRDVYRPFLERMVADRALPIALHVSGPLLEWMEAHAANWLDLVGRLAADGRVELLLSGFYEPILAVLPRADRLEQIAWMREWLQRRFGVTPAGLWLTERVWEPDLAADLAAAGVGYALVDDRHFLVTGFRRDDLHVPYVTEHDGRTLGLLPIDERLRYLVPFRPPHETAEYLRSLQAAGRPMAVLADDGEKFGGWPGTKEWVYDKGWLDQFLAMLTALREAGTIELVTPGAAMRDVPSGGLAYLPTASYREMEQWALPPDAATRLLALEHDLGPRMNGPDGALVRGAPWRHFLVKYAEANRMHKKMMAVSALCRARGDPPAARRAVGRAQCNDAYWHGVFGGLYLPHLRAAIWRCLAEAEGLLRTGEAPACERLDLDGDGHPELWVHAAAFSAVVRPVGGLVTDLTRFAEGANLADTLTRRREAYHDAALAAGAAARQGGGGTASIHDLERGLRLDALPVFDADERALFVDRVLGATLGPEAWARGDGTPLRSWARVAFEPAIAVRADAVEVVLTAPDLTKRLTFHADGRLEAAWRWDPAAWPADAWFAPELSLARVPPLTLDPDVEVWSYPIKTMSKSERGFDETLQGEAVTPRWPMGAGRARVVLG